MEGGDKGRVGEMSSSSKRRQSLRGETRLEESTMSVNQQQEATREERFFGISPVKFVDDACIAIEDYISDAVDFMEGQIKQRAQRERVSEETIAACADALHGAFMRACDTNFDKLEIYLQRNILRVPEDVDLSMNRVEEQKSEDAPGEGATSMEVESHEMALDQELAALEVEIKKANEEKQYLTVSIDMISQQLSQGKEKLAELEFVNDSVDPNVVERILKRTRVLEETYSEAKSLLSTTSESHHHQQQQPHAHHPKIQPSGENVAPSLQQRNTKSKLCDVKKFKERLLSNVSNLPSHNK